MYEDERRGSAELRECSFRPKLVAQTAQRNRQLKLARARRALASAKEQQRSCESRWSALDDEESQMEEDLARAIEACSFAIPDSPPSVASVPQTSLAGPRALGFAFCAPQEDAPLAASVASFSSASVSDFRDRRAVFLRRARINRLQILDEVQKAEADARKALAMVPDADASASSSLCADFDWRLADRLQAEVMSADDMCPVLSVLSAARSCSPSSRSHFGQQQPPIR